MQSVFDLPEDKRAHRFIPREKEDFFYPGGRSDNDNVIEIHKMSGRQPDTQKKLIKSLFPLFREIEEQLTISPTDIEITIHEQAPYQWGFRGMTEYEASDLKYKLNV